MIKHLKTWQLWIAVLLLLCTAIPTIRNNLFTFVDVARASDVRQQQIVQSKTLEVTLEIVKTQNKILEVVTDSSTGIDSVKQVIYLQILKEQLDSLKRLLPQDTLR